ncbi:MAG: hypothetical protein JXP34_12980 [Planctomycetes bacterium]|nr:hypothetical protein [Planctomycetota bacterium]
MRDGFAACGGLAALAALGWMLGPAGCTRSSPAVAYASGVGETGQGAVAPSDGKRFSIVYSVHNHGYVEPCG